MKCGICAGTRCKSSEEAGDVSGCGHSHNNNAIDIITILTLRQTAALMALTRPGWWATVGRLMSAAYNYATIQGGVLTVRDKANKTMSYINHAEYLNLETAHAAHGLLLCGVPDSALLLWGLLILALLPLDRWSIHNQYPGRRCRGVDELELDLDAPEISAMLPAPLP